MLVTLGLFCAAHANAGDLSSKSLLTFNQSFEVPGHTLPAGTYTFIVADADTRNIVRIFNADGSRLIGTFLTIGDYRSETTSETVILFNEVPGVQNVVGTWFFLGHSVGRRFLYPSRTKLAIVNRRGD
jgi:hypothetical protein